MLRSLRDKESDLEKLRQEAQDISRSAQTAVQCCGDMFTAITILLEKRRAEVEQQIRSELEIRLGQVQEVQDELQREITELRRSVAELEEPVNARDHKQVTPRCPLVSTDAYGAEQRDFEFVTRAVSDLRDKLQLILGEFELSW